MSHEPSKVELIKVDIAKPLQSGDNVAALLAQYQKSFARVAPQHLDINRMLRVALMTMQRSPYLLGATGSSLLGAFMLAAQLGLDIAAKEAYLVPFNNSKTRMREIQLVPDYRGIMKLVRNSGQVSNMRARVVYKEDFFILEEGMNPRLEHKPNFDVEKKDENIIGCYSIADFCDADRKPTGYKDAHFISRQHIERVRNGSPSKDSGPWKDFYSEMAMKTCVKHHSKSLPQSVELAQAMILDNRAEMNKPQQIELTASGDLLLADITDDPQPTEQEKADKTDKTPKPGKSKLDAVVAAARDAEKKKDPEQQKPTEQQQSTTQQKEGEPEKSTDEDWNQIGDLVFERHNKVSMKQVSEHIMQTMGFKHQRDLTRDRLKEVHDWIKAKSA